MVLRDRDANASGGDGLEATPLRHPRRQLQHHRPHRHGRQRCRAVHLRPLRPGHRPGCQLATHNRQPGLAIPPPGRPLRPTLHHFRFRDLNAELGRWVSQDPLGHVDGANVYEVAKSHPIIGVDPFGLSTWSTQRCHELLQKIASQVEKLRKEYAESDPIRDAAGDFQTKEGVTLNYDRSFAFTVPAGLQVRQERGSS